MRRSLFAVLVVLCVLLASGGYRIVAPTQLNIGVKDHLVASSCPHAHASALVKADQQPMRQQKHRHCQFDKAVGVAGLDFTLPQQSLFGLTQQTDPAPATRRSTIFRPPRHFG